MTAHALVIIRRQEAHSILSPCISSSDGEFASYCPVAAGFALSWSSWRTANTKACAGGEWPEWFELCAVLGDHPHEYVSGRLRQTVGSQELFLCNGQRPWEQRFERIGGTNVFLQFILSSELVEEAARAVLGASTAEAFAPLRRSGVLFPTLSLGESAVRMVLDDLDADLQAGVPVPRLEAETAALGLALIGLARACGQHPAARAPLWRFHPGSWQGQRLAARVDAVRRARAHINSHLAEPIGLHDIAAAAGVSPAHLCALFKQTTGMTPGAYLNAARLEAGRALLDVTDFTVTEVAGAVGYDQVSYFTARFRRRYGVSPSEYRRGGAIR